MKPTSLSGQNRHGLRGLFLVAGLLSLAGCASQAPLRPPTLRLPASVRSLNAQRSGAGVDLAWTNPTRTTDGVALTGKHGAGKLSAEICRAERFAAGSICPSIATIPVVAGAPASFHDALPPELLTGPDRALRYRIRVLNGVGKGAQYAEVLTAAGEAPAAVQDLSASPVAAGIAVRWRPGATPEDRTLLRVTRGEAPPVAFRDAPSSPGSAPAGKTPATALLAVEPASHDPGGALDVGGRAGAEQRYTVYRSRSVHIGDSDLSIHGESASVTVAASALAPPPAPPSGLEALADTLGSPSIDLVWQVDTEPGVGGYLVFRSDAASGRRQLTSTPVRGFSYSDTTAQPGVEYRYSVAAVSADGRAGEPGHEIPASIPRP